MYGQQVAKQTQGAQNLFADGMEGSEDLGQTIIMRRDIPDLPRAYWVQIGDEDQAEATNEGADEKKKNAAKKGKKAPAKKVAKKAPKKKAAPKKTKKITEKGKGKKPAPVKKVKPGNEAPEKVMMDINGKHALKRTTFYTGLEEDVHYDDENVQLRQEDDFDIDEDVEVEEEVEMEAEDEDEAGDEGKPKKAAAKKVKPGNEAPEKIMMDYNPKRDPKRTTFYNQVSEPEAHSEAALAEVAAVEPAKAPLPGNEAPEKVMMDYNPPHSETRTTFYDAQEPAEGF